MAKCLILQLLSMRKYSERDCAYYLFCARVRYRIHHRRRSLKMTLEELNGAFVDVIGCVNPKHSQLSGYINGAQDLYSALVLNVDKQKSDNKREDPVTIAEMVSLIKCKGASDLGNCCDRCAFQYTTDECFSICLLDLERINDVEDTKSFDAKKIETAVIRARKDVKR